MANEDEDCPFGIEIERLAADLWRRENPDMSVFACDAKMKDEYRQRILAEREPKK